MIRKQKRPQRIQKTRAERNVAALKSSEWISVPEAVNEAHQSKPIIYEWIKQGWIESFVLKSRPDSQAGTRLVRRSSLMEFLDKQCREQQINPTFVRRPGHEKPVEAIK
jgi:hypothetical protein